jgi:Fic family protein
LGVWKDIKTVQKKGFINIMNIDRVSDLDNQEFMTALKKYLKIEFSEQIRNGVYGYTSRELAYHSNKIEGSTLTKEQTASLFDTQAIVSTDSLEVYRSKDVEEANGHFLMFNHMLKTLDKELSEKLIKELHYQLKAGVFEDRANGYKIGDYKDRANVVSDITTAKPAQVPDQMSALISEWNTKTKSEITLTDILDFHAKFEMIHPFQDGNGRVGRILIFRECLRNNSVPFIFDADNKIAYRTALNTSQKSGDYTLLLKVAETAQKKYYEAVKGMIISNTNS